MINGVKQQHRYILLFVVLLFLTGCSSFKGFRTLEKQTDGNKSTSFTIMANLHSNQLPTERIEKVLEERTGMNLTIQWVADSYYEEKLQTGFASKTLPEALFLKNQANFLQWKESVTDDRFWEIGPYLSDFPNLSKLDPQTLSNTQVNGKIYALYQGRPFSRQGIIYRKDWAEHLGLSAPETIEDVYNLAKAFTENDPDGNGSNDTVGIADRSDLIYGGFKTVSSWFGTPNNWGIKNGELIPEFMFDEYIETMDFYKRLVDEGYINSDFPVTSGQHQKEMMIQGKAGIYIGNISIVDTLYHSAEKTNPDVQFDVQTKISDTNHEYGIWALAGYGNLVLFPKDSIESEDRLLEILGFFDFLMSEEGANLIYWGIEGEHYEVIDGKAVILDQSLFNSEVKAHQALEIGEPRTNQRYLGSFTYDIKEKADRLVEENNQYLIVDPTIQLESVTFTEYGNDLQQIINEATLKYILSEIDLEGFNEAIHHWLDEGGSLIIEEYNISYANSNKFE